MMKTLWIDLLALPLAVVFVSAGPRALAQEK